MHTGKNWLKMSQLLLVLFVTPSAYPVVVAVPVPLAAAGAADLSGAVGSAGFVVWCFLVGGEEGVIGGVEALVGVMSRGVVIGGAVKLIEVLPACVQGCGQGHVACDFIAGTVEGPDGVAFDGPGLGHFVGLGGGRAPRAGLDFRAADSGKRYGYCGYE